MKRNYLLMLAILALTGCKSELAVPVTYNEIYGQSQIKKALLKLEVPSCEQTNTKMESREVLQARQQMRYIFPESAYLECKKEGMNSLAEFEVPVQVGGIGARDCSAEQVCVASSTNNVLANIYIGKGIRKRIDKVLKDLMLFNLDSLEVTLNFTNDSGSELKPRLPDVFYSDASGRMQPLHEPDAVVIPTNSSCMMTLSNIGSARLLKKGYAWIAEFPDRGVEDLLPGAKPAWE